ncbi:MAG: ankyrin repeat domain-containing protein [Bradymonadia bacterium]
MSKSPLTRACYDHDLEKVRALIAQGAPVDASDNEVWSDTAEGCLSGAPYYTPLGEACRSTYGDIETQSAIVAALLEAGAPVNQRNYRNETALHFACQSGRAEIIRQIATADADLTAVGCLGNAVSALVTHMDLDEPSGQRVGALRVLLALGADPRLPDAWGKDLVRSMGDFTGWLTSRSRHEKARGVAALERMEVVADAVGDYPALNEWLETHRAAQLQGDAKLRKVYEKLDKLRAAASEKGFDKKFARAIGKSIVGRYEDLARLTKHVLMAPEVVAHPDWATLVCALLERTMSYGDVTEETYGQRLTLDQMEDDEGGALDYYADEHLSTVEHCLVACRAEGAWSRSDFGDLVREIAETKYARIGYMSFGDEEAVALAAHLDTVGSPDAESLRADLRKGFPFAGL